LPSVQIQCTVHSSYVLDSGYVDIKFFIFYLVCMGMYPIMSSLHKSEEVCYSVLVIIMNIYSLQCPFPKWTMWRTAYQRLWASQRVILTTSLPLRVNFHHRFPIKLSIPPQAVHFPCCLKIIVTLMSGLNRSLWPFTYTKNMHLSVLLILYCFIGYQDALDMNMISRKQMNYKSMLDVLF
jgi:hypothetical protein